MIDTKHVRLKIRIREAFPGLSWRIFILFFSLLSLNLFAQVSLSDYQRGDSTRNFTSLVLNTVVEMEWIDSTELFWYSSRKASGVEYWIVDAKKTSQKLAFDQQKFCENLNRFLTKEYTIYEFPIKELKLSKDLKSCNFVIDKTRYSCDFKKYEFLKIEEIDQKPEEYWGNMPDETFGKPVISPDSLYEAYIRDYNVFIREKETESEEQLSYDGSEGEFYSSGLNWSPDSKKVAGFRVRANQKRYMTFVESTPGNQFLPLLHRREYLRPGDALPIRQPVLFDISTGKQIRIDSDNLLDQFALENLTWEPDSKSFTFEFNQRGHQLYQVLRVDAELGKTSCIIEERSNTFIDYSGKRYRHDIKSTREIIWASERDGWNHLYLFDGKTGLLKNQITKGEWVVRHVLNIDDENRNIYFAGSGRNQDEDPYNLHCYVVNFDGTGFIDLTPEPLYHTVEFSATHAYFTDTYSTPNVPPVTVLRESKTGKIVLKIEEANIQSLLAEGYTLPEPFVAKGRDGITDIYGNIYRPINFDSTKVYPIIEYIYAGPQSSYVQKSFRPYSYPFSGLAELGFIIIQIDGMGTSNRSKAFHDICFKNLKDAGFDDRIAWIKEAANKYSYMDTNRVGIFGGSAGGQNAAAALLFHPEFYKVGVSSCGCHDNRIDKMWWNEQWMGYPVGPHYAACSNSVNASNLQGKLMLIVGEVDDNVDPSSTYQFVHALIKENKEFELVLLPGVSHTLGGDFGERKRRDFFVQHLLGVQTPNWNN